MEHQTMCRRILSLADVLHIAQDVCADCLFARSVELLGVSMFVAACSEIKWVLGCTAVPILSHPDDLLFKRKRSMPNSWYAAVAEYNHSHLSLRARDTSPALF